MYVVHYMGLIPSLGSIVIPGPLFFTGNYEMVFMIRKKRGDEEIYFTLPLGTRMSASDLLAHALDEILEPNLVANRISLAPSAMELTVGE